jgi:glycosyltransferase involved in cell wall biosynthesis
MSVPSRHFVLVIHALSGGGAERVMVEMAGHWVARGDRVTIVTLDEGQRDVYVCDPRVERIALNVLGQSHGIGHALVQNWRRVRSLRAAIRQADPDGIVAFTEQINVLTLLANWGRATPVIIGERTDPRFHPVPRIWSWLRRRCYWACSAAVVQNEAVRAWLQPLVGRAPVVTIPNYVQRPSVTEWESAQQIRRQRQAGQRVLIAAGRLAEEKRFDFLIDAFSAVELEVRKDWELQIYGEGPCRSALASQIEQLGVGEQVRLCGWTSELGTQLAAADLFALTSRYEGFPNVLLEAMVRGLAVVCSDCPSGPTEIIRHGRDGLLLPVEDRKEWTATLTRLFQSEPLRNQLGHEALAVAERFNPDRFYARWETLFQQTGIPGALAQATVNEGRRPSLRQ